MCRQKSVLFRNGAAVLIATKAGRVSMATTLSPQAAKEYFIDLINFYIANGHIPSVFIHLLGCIKSYSFAFLNSKKFYAHVSLNC